MMNSLYARYAKATLDVLAAAGGLVVLAPLFLVIAALVKATSRGPVFFRQTRVGQFGRPFRIFKFRSMRIGSAGRGALLTTAVDPRVTPVGRILRKSKLDELPQLINVVLGQMSLVGPRPEVPEYVAVYSAEQRGVFRFKPGITGLVAMHNVQEEELLAAQKDKDRFYREVLLPAKLTLDLRYCGNVRPSEDGRILFGTFLKLFRRSSGASSVLSQVAGKQNESELAVTVARPDGPRPEQRLVL